MKQYLKPKKKARRPIYQKNEKEKGKDLEALCVMSQADTISDV